MKIKDLVKSKSNIREESEDEDFEALRDSIKNHSLINRIVVRPGKSGKYEVIAGWRRCLALQDLNGPEYELTENDVTVKEGLDDDAAVFLSIEENQQRKMLSPLSLNKAILVMNQKGVKDKEIAKALNITPHRLKRLGELSADLKHMPEKAKEELGKSPDKAKFDDRHWSKLREVETPEVIKDVVDYIIDKESPPREVPSIIKAVEKNHQAAEGSEDEGSSAETHTGSEDEPVGPIEYSHKGILTMDESSGKLVFKVEGKGEDGEVPVDQYLEYLRHPEKFKCRVTFKLKITPVE